MIQDQKTGHNIKEGMLSVDFHQPTSIERWLEKLLYTNHKTAIVVGNKEGVEIAKMVKQKRMGDILSVYRYSTFPIDASDAGLFHGHITRTNDDHGELLYFIEQQTGSEKEHIQICFTPQHFALLKEAA